MTNFDLKPVAASATCDGALPAIVLELLQASQQLIGIFDQHDILRFANSAFVQTFHRHPDGSSTWVDLLRDNYRHRRGSLINTQDFEAWLASARSRRGKEPFRAFEFDIHGGRWFWMTETTLANGWMLCVASDITTLHQDGRSLRQTRDLALRTAQTDTLTGISNRAHIRQLTDDFIAQSQPFVLVLLDLDHFKSINDTYGHPAGDEVLRDFARHLQACTRREDSCARVGGEEFMMLLPDVDMAQAQAITQRLLTGVRTARPLADAPEQGYTTSAGLARHRSGECFTGLYRRADQTLYRAKRTGRDRLVCDDA
ncbi:GGDEF domain-containing protein [Alcaligenaceae bacterium]|nr:GGDEF domain-containing protein [Alcaligenaceae bacterium]